MAWSGSATTTATGTPAAGADPRRRRLPAALALLAAPKCLGCFWAWTGLGAALAGPEWCGAADSPGWTGLAWLPYAAGLGLALGHLLRRRRARDQVPRKSPSRIGKMGRPSRSELTRSSSRATE
jgi:hypothetical protein